MCVTHTMSADAVPGAVLAAPPAARESVRFDGASDLSLTLAPPPTDSSSSSGTAGQPMQTHTSRHAFVDGLVAGAKSAGEYAKSDIREKKKQFSHLHHSSSAALDLPACTVWVGNVPQGIATSARMKKLFEQNYGEVQTVTVRRKELPLRSWAFVTFMEPDVSTQHRYPIRTTTTFPGRGIS